MRPPPRSTLFPYTTLFRSCSRSTSPRASPWAPSRADAPAPQRLERCIMKDHTKYQGVIPAFYACYGQDGSISTEGVKALTRHLIAKGVKGVYVGGASGECI